MWSTIDFLLGMMLGAVLSVLILYLVWAIGEVMARFEDRWGE